MPGVGIDLTGIKRAAHTNTGHVGLHIEPTIGTLKPMPDLVILAIVCNMLPGANLHKGRFTIPTFEVYGTWVPFQVFDHSFPPYNTIILDT